MSSLKLLAGFILTVLVSCNSSDHRTFDIELLEVRMDSVFAIAKEVDIDSLDMMIQTSRERLVEIKKRDLSELPDTDRLSNAKQELEKIRKIQKTGSSFREFEIDYSERKEALDRLSQSIEKGEYDDSTYNSFLKLETNHVKNFEEQVLNFNEIYSIARVFYDRSLPYIDTLITELPLYQSND